MSTIIDFIVDGAVFASRTWGVVPRAGEVVILKEGKKWVEVVQIIWADDSAAPRSMERQWVQLVCKEIEPLAT